MNELEEPWKTAGERKGLTSLRAISRESGASVETVRQVLAGRRKPSPGTTAKLATALGVPPSTIDQWTGTAGSDIDAPYRPPAHAARLTARQRNAVDELIMAMVEPRPAPPQAPAGTTDEYRLAARHGMDEDRKKRE